jgi:hypothetical protein
MLLTTYGYVAAHRVRSALGAAATLVLIATPLAVRADEVSIMQACATAFIAEALPKEQPVRVLTAGSAARRPDERQGGYEILLTATGSTSGRLLAKASCIVSGDRAAIVVKGKRTAVSLASVAPTSKEATAAR